MGWNDLAFLSVFSLLFSLFFGSWSSRRVEWDGNLFFLAAAERKGTRKTEQNGTGLASDNDDDDGDGREHVVVVWNCSEENGNQAESRVEMKRDETR